jgi:predicted alpha/beta superfamily hydrolase
MSRSPQYLMLAALLLLIGCQPRPDKAVERVPEPALADSQSRVVTSSVTGREYQVTVALPRGYADSDEKYPVLIALDANGQLGTVVEAARQLRFDEAVPEMLVVGVGYPVGRMWNAQSPRAVDLTPTGDPEWVSERPHKYPQFPPPEGSGGGPGFLRFLVDELIPLIESEYRADPMDRGLFGHSFGGLFGTYALLSSGGAFQRFIIASPSLWWDDRVLFELEAEYHAIHEALPARAFFSVGLLEEPEGSEEAAAFRMVSNLRDFISVLEQRRYVGLDMESMLYADETHNSVIAPSVTRGLRSVYRGWSTQTN